MKVSFDYDYTLDRKDVQKYATELVNLGFDVWVVTSRFDTETALSRNWTWIEDSNLRLFSVVEKCGIPKEKVVFTNMESKSIYIDGKGFIFHLDDCDIELGDINNIDDSCIGIDVDKDNWMELCDDIIKK